MKNHAERLLRGIQKMLQAPALDASAAVREHGKNIAGFDAHVAFARLANNGCSRWYSGKLRRRLRGMLRSWGLVT